MPLDTDEEVGFTYSLLSYGIENLWSYWTFASNGYGLDSRKIQDKIDAFNDEVVRHFVNNITKYLENLTIDCANDFKIIEEEKRYFISYCWTDIDIANMIDNDFKNMYGITLTRDERDLKFKKTIKDFMNTLNDHEFVIMIISDSYIKYNNCMYEVMEVMRDRRYRDKIYYIVLK